MAAPRKAPAVTKRLEAARRALESGDGGAALEVLLELWERERLKPVAKAVTRLSARLDVPSLETPENQEQAYRLWTARAKALRPVDGGPLLAALNAASLHPRLLEHFIRGRLAQLARFPTDPRIDSALHQLEGRISNLGWYTDYLKARRRHHREGDAGTKALERELAAPLDALLGLVLSAKLKPIPLPDAAQPGVETPAQLVAAVLADPLNAQLRQVVADRLLEQGDPRGEFIALQVQRAQGTQTAEGFQRELFLRRKHGKEWLGALAPHVVQSDVRFEAGFPVAVRTTANRVYKAREAAALEEWATVREVEFPAVSYFGPHMRSLEIARGVEVNGVLMLFELEAPPPLELLELTPHGSVARGRPADWRWPLVLPRLTKLRALEVWEPPTYANPHRAEEVMAAIARHLPPSLERLSVRRLRFDPRIEPDRVRAIVVMMPGHLQRLELNDQVYDRVGRDWERRRR